MSDAYHFMTRAAQNDESSDDADLDELREAAEDLTERVREVADDMGEDVSEYVAHSGALNQIDSDEKSRATVKRGAPSPHSQAANTGDGDAEDYVSQAGASNHLDAKDGE